MRRVAVGEIFRGSPRYLCKDTGVQTVSYM
jgi:hypothetical protein